MLKDKISNKGRIFVWFPCVSFFSFSFCFCLFVCLFCFVCLFLVGCFVVVVFSNDHLSGKCRWSVQLLRKLLL